MAQIRLDDIERIEKARNVLHEKVYTTYTSFEKMGKNIFSWILMVQAAVKFLKK